MRYKFIAFRDSKYDKPFLHLGINRTAGRYPIFEKTLNELLILGSRGACFLSHDRDFLWLRRSGVLMIRFVSSTVVMPVFNRPGCGQCYQL